MARRKRQADCHPGRPRLRLLSGDCLEALPALPAESIDAVVTDPPYAIGFQNESWDSRAIEEAAAIAGAEGLSQNEAFEFWCRAWAAECLRVMKPGAYLLAFGSPRTFHRLAAGLEDAGLELRDTLMWLYGSGMPKSRKLPRGRGTALKPGYEPIVLARKRPVGTITESIRHHGTGALEVDACRIGERWPADVALSHEEECTSARCVRGCPVDQLDRSVCDERGSVSRFFYCPKTSRRERDAGCEHLSAKALDLFPSASKRSGDARNTHPTVKPLALMRWLVRLATPPRGLVLDPFTGSGTTGAAAACEDRRFLGIEREPAYIEIATARIDHWARGDRRVDSSPLGKKT